jgi:hypothetical protein
MSFSPVSLWFLEMMHDPNTALCYKIKGAKELLRLMHDPTANMEQRIECAVILLEMQALGIINGAPPWEPLMSKVPSPSLLIH